MDIHNAGQLYFSDFWSYREKKKLTSYQSGTSILAIHCSVLLYMQDIQIHEQRWAWERVIWHFSRLNCLVLKEQSVYKWTNVSTWYKKKERAGGLQVFGSIGKCFPPHKLQNQFIEGWRHVN